jgi:aminopeptidase N
VPHNLTRDEARERARLLAVTSYRIDLDLTGGGDGFSSRTVVTFRCAVPGAATFIDLTAKSVSGITLNGEPVPPERFDGDRIALTGLAAENVLTVSAQCAYSRSSEGLHRFADPADGAVYVYSDLETFEAHRVYACFDQPDLKAVYEFTVTAPADWQVISNMAPDVAGEPADAAGAVRRWHFPPTPVMSTYITAIAAGGYHVVRDDHDGIPLGIYCRSSLARYLDPGEIFEVTKRGFDFFHAMFGYRYPFGKYDQVFVPEFKAGAMENAGCVTFVESYIFRSRVTDYAREARGDTILHEMAHMWFGDLVTMRWWDDLWLNESFATWAATFAQAQATRWAHAWTTFAQLHKAWAYRQDQLPSTHPIAADIVDIEAVEVNFDGITYAKGAAVIKQLVAYVGLENFLAGVRAYFGQHAFGNATLGDFLAALEQASGRELSLWSKEWLETAGVNTLRPDFTLDPDGRFRSFAVIQEAPQAHPVLRSHRIAIGLYDLTRSGLVRRRVVEADIAGERTVIADLTGDTQPDLVLINDDDLTYAKVRLDDRSLTTLLTSISEFADPLPAALCWAAAWDMCRDAELAPRDYLRLVLGGLSSVGDISVLQTLLTQARSAVNLYADPAWRPAGRELAASSLRALLESAEPGSDTQLTYAKALASFATSEQDLALLAGLLAGTAQLDGLSVDTELRWSLLSRLVARGAAGPERIEAELSRDPTDAGERRAATCRAAIPDPAAKRAAWEAITGGELSVAMFRATLAGFMDAERPDLMAPYAEAYFEEVGRIWREWGGDMAQWFATNAYPLPGASPSTLALTDEYLDRSDPPPPLRRLISEGADTLRRALRCQERDRRAN